MNTLLQDGVVVIPAFTLEDTQLYHQAFWNTVKTFPEYLTHDVYVMGAFGALGNPASFHNPMVRNFRLNIMIRAIHLFSGLDNRNLEQLPDRMSIRRAGTALTKESWHRDQAPSLNGDDIFGGWVNLDLDRVQKFSCIPGSQLRRNETGFLKEVPTDISQKRIIEVPSGHLIIFYQNILHEVLPGKTNQDSIRVYTGFRLTHSSESLYDQTNAIMRQGVLKNPSGQVPPMWYPQHLNFHSQKLIPWSQNFKPECLEEKNTPKLGKYSVVHRHMMSLDEYGFPRYPEYHEDELSILNPRRNWVINGQCYKL